MNKVLKDIDKLTRVFFKIPEKIRYLLVGGFNTVFGYFVFVSLVFFFDEVLHYNIILFIQYIITISVSYINMKVFVFRSKGNHVREYIKVFFTYMLAYFLNALLLYLLQFIGINLYVSQAVSLVIITLIVYLVHKNVNYR